MRVTYNQGDQRISVVPIHPATGAVVLVDSGSDVTVSIVDLRYGDQSSDHTVLATTVVSQDPLAATLTGSAGYSQADPHRLPLDASAAALGRTYVLVDADGQQETVQLRSIGATAAFTVHDLRRNYETGDTLRGVELVATFPAATADEENNVEDKGGPYLVTWTYRVDGQTVVLPTELFLDRYSLTPPIDDQWVLRGQPDFAARGREQVTTAIQAAWDDWLAAVEGHGEDPTLFPAGHTAKVGMRKLALSYLHRWASGGETDTTRADALQAEAERLFSDVLVGHAPQGQVKLTRDDVGHDPEPKGHVWRLS